jgi:hypothetical protein
MVPFFRSPLWHRPARHVLPIIWTSQNWMDSLGKFGRTVTLTWRSLCARQYVWGKDGY